MTENWEDIPEFPYYAVSDHGRVMNKYTEHIKSVSINQQGIASVLLVNGRQQFRRSVTVLVAEAFLPLPPRRAFNTPINLNGDRLDNHVDNLAWRPRWFAAKYHAQYRQPIPFGFSGQVELIETEEIFESVRDAAKTYGLLEKEIIMSVHNHVPVFPTWHNFQLVSN
jgi:hypothetical protein